MSKSRKFDYIQLRLGQLGRLEASASDIAREVATQSRSAVDHFVSSVTIRVAISKFGRCPN